MSIMCAWNGIVTSYRLVDGQKGRFLSISLQTDGVGYYSVTVFDDVEMREGELYVGAILSGTGRVRPPRGWAKSDGSVGTEMSITAPGFDVLAVPEIKAGALQRMAGETARDSENGQRPVAPAYAAGPAPRQKSGIKEADLNDEIPF